MAQGAKNKQKTKVWAEQAPYLQEQYARAEGLFNQGAYQYGPDRVAGFAPESEQAMNQGANRSGDLTRATEQNTMRALSEDFIDPRNVPGLERFRDMGTRRLSRDYYSTINSLGSRMEAAGRTGGGTHAYGTQIAGENLATGLGDYNAQLDMGAFGQLLGHQAGARQMAGQVNEMGWRDISGLNRVGMQRQEQRQREVDDLVGRFQQQQYGAAEKLAEFSSMIGTPVMTGKSSGSSWGAITCWCAAVYFDWFTPDWFAARRFILDEMPQSFREFYADNGERISETLREDEGLREKFRPMFEFFRDGGR